MYTNDQLQSLIENYLAQAEFPAEPELLYAPIAYSLSGGGKRLRPMLVLLSHAVFSDNVQQALPAAGAVEVFHNFTLLHDDIMDNAAIRRGKPSVHAKWGRNVAILSGDAMLIYAYRLLSMLPAAQVPQVLATFDTMALEVCEGQQYDMDFECRNDVTEDEYIEMIRLKTSVLLACAMKIGAILADAPAADADLLYKFGEQLGLAFQLQDDLLDVYGDPKVFGKAIGGDITSNKKTYMLINALQRADAFQRAELDRWINAREFDRAEKIAAVTDIYNQLGIREICEARINHYFAESEKCLALVAVADERKAQLREFMANLLKREK